MKIWVLILRLLIKLNISHDIKIIFYLKNYDLIQQNQQTFRFYVDVSIDATNNGYVDVNKKKRGLS